MTTMVEKFARLARETRFADLPDEAVSEAGRIMLAAGPRTNACDAAPKIR